MDERKLRIVQRNVKFLTENSRLVGETSSERIFYTLSKSHISLGWFLVLIEMNFAEGRRRHGRKSFASAHESGKKYDVFHGSFDFTLAQD